MLGIFCKIYGIISSVYILLSDKSKAEMLGHSNRPIKSGIPSTPILFLFNCKVDSFYRVLNPVIFSIILSLRLRFTIFTKHSNPLIYLMRFSWRYKHLRLVSFYKFYIFLMALP
jgi:hypothetical protein